MEAWYGIDMIFHAQCILVKQFNILWFQLEKEMERFLA